MRTSTITTTSLLALGLALGAGCGADPSPSGGSGSSAQAISGKGVYGRCIGCHGPDGRGHPGVYPALKGSAILAKDAELVRSILNGYPPGGRYGGAMPGFARDLSDPQIAALINWMRDEWAPSTPAITAATVAQQRR